MITHIIWKMMQLKKIFTSLLAGTWMELFITLNRDEKWGLSTWEENFVSFYWQNGNNWLGWHWAYSYFSDLVQQSRWSGRGIEEATLVSNASKFTLELWALPIVGWKYLMFGSLSHLFRSWQGIVEAQDAFQIQLFMVLGQRI